MQSVAVSTIRDGFFEAFWRSFAGPHMSKRASRAARSSPRTAERWASGKATPLFEQVVAMCAESPAFEAEMTRLIQDVREGRRR